MLILTPCDELGCVGVFLDKDQMKAALPRNGKTYAVYKWDVADNADHVYVIPYNKSDLPAFVTDDLKKAEKFQQDLASVNIIARDSPEYWCAEIGKMIPSALARLLPSEVGTDLSEVIDTISGLPEEPEPTFDVREMVVPSPLPESPPPEVATGLEQ